MDENLTPVDSEINNNEPEEPGSVFSGFIEMFTSPWEVGRRNIRTVIAVLSLAVLLETIAVGGITYFYSANTGIRQENYQMQTQMIDKMAKGPNFPKEKLPEMYEDIEKGLDFNPTKAIGLGVLMSLLASFGLGILFWIAHRIFTAEPINFMQIVGLVSYGAGISAIGNLITGLMQFFSSSLLIAPNLGFLVGTGDAAMFGLLSRINIFTLWYYAAVGIAIASAVGLTRKHGYIIGGIVYGVIFLSLFGVMKLASIMFG
ncbi:MAG: YIP1 family protein [Bacteroidetes bacterium]|nr:YIP1 family protein [Bacteroidota bacterium]